MKGLLYCLSVSAICMAAPKTALAAPSHSAAPVSALPIQKGWPSPRAKAVLLADGWKPIRNDNKMPDGTLEREFSPASEMSGAGYLEVEDCSEGLVYCQFNYSKGGVCLQLITQGEWIPDIPRVRPKVVSWRYRCARQHNP
jgi:hypothetical protein